MFGFYEDFGCKEGRGDIQVIRNVTEDVRDGDLDVETDGCHGVCFETSESECTDHGWGIGIKTTLWAVVAEGDTDVDPKTPIAELEGNQLAHLTQSKQCERTYSFLEPSKTNTLLLLPLSWIIPQHSVSEDMNLPLTEDLDTRKESTVGVLEAIRQEETKDETRGTSEGTHEHKQPEPSWLASNTSHVKDAVRQKLRGSLTELIAEVEEHDSLGGF